MSRPQRSNPNRRLLIDLLLVLALLLAVHLFAVDSSFVASNSMLPTLQPGDWVLVNSLAYLAEEPERGDVVVFEAPLEPGLEYVKRVVGLPGETVLFTPEGLFLDGELLTEGYLNDSDWKPESGSLPFDGETTTVPAGHYLVLGDNRSESKDSRSWGFLAVEAISGRAEVLVFSCSPASRLHWERIGQSL
ncbi:signal peptidase I [bacterium]|nr:signal peptidase I [bacterium]